MAARLHAEPQADGPTVLVLLDRIMTCLAAIGPFPSPDAAATWQLDGPPDRAVTRMLVPLHPSIPTGIDGSTP